jgi:hypothetical protein
VSRGPGEGWELIRFYVDDQQLFEPAVRAVIQRTLPVEVQYRYEVRMLEYLAWIESRPLVNSFEKAPLLRLEVKKDPMIGDYVRTTAMLVLGSDPVVKEVR